METNLTLLGATGIEDKLQEQVFETVQKLHRAGIVIWMLTGDKKETAVNMSHAAGMVETSNDLIDLCEVLDRKSLFRLIDEVYNTRNNWTLKKPSLVVDGKAIAAITKSETYKSKLSKISTNCHSIVACRLSPVQKSQLVTMIKEADNSYITCAIGDGGNDVSMIQEAHVGLGLIGKEGSAASQSADFAFTKFCHLQRLLLVHVHWFYTRQAFLVQVQPLMFLFYFSKQILETCITKWPCGWLGGYGFFTMGYRAKAARA
jgi:phospholipid-translocating ATPase